MKHEKGQTTKATHPINNTDAKVTKEKQINKVLQYLSLYDGSTLSISDATKVPRCSVCFYVRFLLDAGVIGFVGRRRGRTRRLMKEYSCDRSRWIKNHNRQLSLFDFMEKGGGYE